MLGRLLPLSLVAAALAGVGLAPAALANHNGGEDDLLTELYDTVMDIVFCALFGVDEILKDQLGNGYPGQGVLQVIYQQFQEGGTVYDTLYPIVHNVGGPVESLYYTILALGDEAVVFVNATGTYLGQQALKTYNYAYQVKCWGAETLKLIQRCFDPVQIHEDEGLVLSGAICGANAWLNLATGQTVSLINYLLNVPQYNGPCYHPLWIC